MSSICIIFEVSMPRSMAVDCFIVMGRGDGVRAAFAFGSPCSRFARSGRRGEDASTARAGRSGSSGSVVPRVQAVAKRVPQALQRRLSTTSAGFVGSSGMSPGVDLSRLGWTWLGEMSSCGALLVSMWASFLAHRERRPKKRFQSLVRQRWHSSASKYCRA